MSHRINPLTVAWTLTRRGMVGPPLPLRQLARLRALRTWGLGIAGELRQSAGLVPDRVAVVDDERGPVTYAELVRHANRVSAWLTSRGVGPGDRIGLLARNHAGVLEVLAGADQVGADVVLVNAGLAGEQVAAVAAEQGLSHLLHDDEFASLAAGLEVRTTSESALAEALGRLGEVADPAPPARPGRTVILTSGTTGPPRGASRRTPGGIGPLVTILDRIPVDAGDTVLVSAPLFHTWGYAALQLTLALHGTVVLHRRFDPERVRAVLAGEEVDAFFAVPVMLQRLAELPPPPAPPRRLRVVATSGSAFPAGFATGFLDAWGEVLHNLYGSTEASWVCIATPADLRRHPDTAGTPPLGTRVALLDDDLRPVPPGHVGRIFAGNDLVFDGYTSGEGREVHDGMVATGDRGHVEDGLWFVDGREDDMVVSGGENLHPSSVEAVLVEVPGVREVAVVGVPDEAYGQRVVAFVVLREGARLAEDDLKDAVRTRLARHAVPREVHFVPELPRNAAGKVLARELRDRLP